MAFYMKVKLLSEIFIFKYYNTKKYINNDIIFNFICRGQSERD